MYNPRMPFEQITVVGVGLIGGSIGLAAKSRGLANRVVGVGIDERKLALAAELDAIDAGTVHLADGVKRADLVVVCTPVDRIAEVIRSAAAHCREGTIFTDSGSTKGNIVAELRGSLPRGVSYVPAHPLAGAEQNGVEHARADLFEKRVTILSPEPGFADPGAVATVESFWEGLGARVVHVPLGEHDRILATTSHLPHVVAAATAGVTPRGWLELSAGGFRDVTRIAGGDPELWMAIFQANRDAVLAALAAFSARLQVFQQLIEAGDGGGLIRWLSEAKQVRDALGR